MTSVSFPNSNSFGPIRREKRLSPHTRLSSACRTSWLGRNWSPKRDADEMVRIRRELEIVRELEELGYGGWTFR